MSLKRLVSRPRAAALFLPCLLASAPVVLPAGVEVIPQDDRVIFKIDGELLTEYRFRDTPRPYFYPLLGPGAVPLTRQYPMRNDASDEEQDHPHHRSLWYAHGDVNGVDFWADGAGMGRIVHQKIIEARGDPELGVLRATHNWVSAAGKTVLSDETVVRVRRSSAGRMFDFEITLLAPEGVAVTLGDTKEGTMAVRLAESMRLKPNKHYADKPSGHILQNTGLQDGATWGKRAAWCDYTGLVQGRRMGITIFDHPQNPKYPTWWHVRDYGLFAANPFGVHDFEKKPPGTGDVVIPAGKSLTFKYRFFLHEGEPDVARLRALAAELGQ